MPCSCQPYYTLKERLRALVIPASKPQLENLCLLTFGVFAALHCHLPKLAVRLPLGLRCASLTQRLERLLKNERLAPCRVYAPVARFLLSCFAGGQVRLILDATDVNACCSLLFVALVYKGRALPLAWGLLPPRQDGCFALWKALLTSVNALMPPQTCVLLLADRGFDSLPLMRFCVEHGWDFCLRVQRQRRLLYPNGGRLSVQSVLIGPGQTRLIQGVRLPDWPEQPLALCCGWSDQHEDDQAWYVLSTLPATNAVLAHYRARFQIEEMFRDFKEQGFRLEQTRLQAPERISRLVLALCLAYVWLMNAGVWVVKRGFRRQVDRRKERRLSYFQLGVRYLQRLHAQQLPLRCEFRAYPT